MEVEGVVAHAPSHGALLGGGGRLKETILSLQTRLSQFLDETYNLRASTLKS